MANPVSSVAVNEMEKAVDKFHRLLAAGGRGDHFALGFIKANLAWLLVGLSTPEDALDRMSKHITALEAGWNPIHESMSEFRRREMPDAVAGAR